MTIYKVFKNTADTVKREKFGAHFFISYENAKAFREAQLKDEISIAKSSDRINHRTVGREVAQDGNDRIRITAAYKKDFLNGTTCSAWYEIMKIETED